MLSIKHFVQQSWLLIVASFSFGLLIAVTNAGLSPVIEQNRINKLNRLVASLLPEAKNFVPLDEPIQIRSVHGQKEDVTVYKAFSGDQCVGYSFNAQGSGFADKIELVVAVDKDFRKLAGFNVLASNETPNSGDRIKEEDFRDQFKGAPTEQLRLISGGDRQKKDAEIVAISGATVSSQAVVDIINQYLLQIKNRMQEKGLVANGK